MSSSKTPKTLERRAFLASTAATVLVGLDGCTNGTASPSDATTGNITGTSTTTDPTTSSPSSSTTTSEPTTSSTPGTTPTTTTSQPTSSTSEPPLDSSSGPTGGIESSSDDVSSSGGTGAATSSETSTSGEASVSSGENTGAGEVSCAAATSNGDHSHPLLIPGEDIAAGYAEKTYTLEDGGTGHTHTVTLTAYDFLYLGGGSSTTVVSTMDEGHSHPCTIACAASNASLVCVTSTDNGDHAHPLVIPGEDISAGFAEKTYTLEDGGTGHTHTVTLTAYDFLYLQAGTSTTIVSTMDESHSHPCQISCTGA